MTDEAREVASLLSVDQAIEIIDVAPVRPRAIDVNLADAAGHYLAQPIKSDRDYPPFDKSLMDGFSVRCADTAHVPVDLKITGEILAGMKADRLLGAGEAMAIMTGAPLPSGADGVVPIEDAEVAADRVLIRAPALPGRFIARLGSDCRMGQTLLQPATRLLPVQLAVAASVGAESLRVFALPRVGILTTGDEIIQGGNPHPHQIRDANGPMLTALVRRLGYPVSGMAHLLDDASAVRAGIEMALAGSDVLLIAGGMSVGRRDFVPAALEELGFDLRIRKLRIKPGKPFVFATAEQGNEDRFVFGLPGNPVSAFVCTIRLVERLLCRLAGGVPDSGVKLMPLAEPLGPNGPREFYQPAEGTPSGSVKPLQWKGSADVFTLAQAAALIVRAEFAPAAATGTLLPVMILP